MRVFTHQYVYYTNMYAYIYIDPYIHNMYVICLIHQYPDQLNQLLKRTLPVK